MPPEKCASALARYSRSADSIRESIASGHAGEHVAYLADFIASSQRGIIK